jgi:iron complex outermembrane receptor protein
MKVINFLLLIVVITGLHATEESMDDLLNTFEQKSDLSHKTKIANAGNTIVITREELERTQMRTLKELINSLNLLNYAESRFGFSDPNYIANSYPFSSNSIRFYIDDQEISSAAYGSGLFYLGDIELGFVNHIEIYTINPSYEYATEAAKFLIKIYSKVAERDSGTKFDVTLGTHRYDQKSIQHINKVNGISYLSYLSHLNGVREKHESFDSPLFRDKDRLFLFNKISTDNQVLQLQFIKNRQHAFMGISPDAVTHGAKIDADYYHVGYQNSVVENLKLSLVLEKAEIIGDYKNNFHELYHVVDEKLATVDLQYKLTPFNNNELIIGAKHRYKDFTTSTFFHDVPFPPLDYTKQNLTSFYLEDQYAFNSEWLLSLGMQMGKVKNNATVKNQNLWMSRVGLVYINDNWVSKTFLHHSSFLMEPYLYISTLPDTDQESIHPETTTNITQELSYKDSKHHIRTVLGYNYRKDPLIVRSGGLQNYEKRERGVFTELNYNYQYNPNTIGKVGLSYQKRDSIYTDYIPLTSLKEYKAVVALSNKMGKFDFYNQLIYNRNSFLKKDFFDYGLRVKYHYNDNLKFSLKGQNILNKAREDYFERGRRDVSSGKWLVLEPLYISPIDQQVYLTMEYLF